MAGARGYHSYRGRTPKSRIVLAVILVVIILAAVLFMVFQQFVVYDETGHARLDLPWQTEEPSQEEEPPDNVEITVEKPERTETKTLQLDAAPLTDWDSAAAQAAAMMIAMHDTKTDIMCYYDARIGTSCYGGLFHPMTYEPLCTYYAFKAYGELYALGRCAEVRGGSDELRALAASDGNGSKAVLIANTGSPETVETNLPGMKVYLLDQDRFLTETDLDSRSFRLEENQVALLKSSD